LIRKIWRCGAWSCEIRRCDDLSSEIRRSELVGGEEEAGGTRKGGECTEKEKEV